MRSILGITLAILICAAAAPANVSVKRDPPDVKTKTFDPNNPPAEMPHLHPPEIAVTTSSYGIGAGADFEPITRKQTEDGWTTLIAVHGITLHLQLHIVIWVPTGVTDKIKAHEEGHRKIWEMIYAERALPAARAAGATADGKRFTGEGPDWRTAANNAINPHIDALGKEYLRQTSDIGGEINNIYDDLTQHGTNQVPEAEAIKQAFAKYWETHTDALAPAKKKNGAGADAK